MTDILEILPDFNLKPFSHLVHSLEKYDITVVDLITLDPVEIVRRCPLPLVDVRKLIALLISRLQGDVEHDTRLFSIEDCGLLSDTEGSGSQEKETDQHNQILIRTGRVRTLDETLDNALGGGIPTGYVTEVAGESSAGKTQFVLGLLLSIQLSPPQGLAKSAIYISTEGPLSTSRLQQILQTHPTYQSLEEDERPSMDRVHLITVNDLEAQEHIIQYSLPVAVDRYNAGLVIIDSVTANFRAEHETRTPSGLAERASALVRLGSTLKRLATEKDIAVITVNQVSDRFDDIIPLSTPDQFVSSSPSMSSSPMDQNNVTTSTATSRPLATNLWSLDHQQRFFTGWGDRQATHREALKTPALGLTWSNHISARIVLKMEGERMHYAGGNIWKDRKRRRFMDVVFAPWTPATVGSVECEINEHGIVSVSAAESQNNEDLMSDLKLLDASFWVEDGAEDFL